MTDKLIKAKDVKCGHEGCRNKGYRWISGDPDIPPVALCKKHLQEFEMRLWGVLDGKGAKKK